MHAGDERAITNIGQVNEKWAARQVSYLDRLIHEAGHQPGEWQLAFVPRCGLSVGACSGGEPPVAPVLRLRGRGLISGSSMGPLPGRREMEPRDIGAGRLAGSSS
jgi:hypothetical protein